MQTCSEAKKKSRKSCSASLVDSTAVEAIAIPVLLTSLSMALGAPSEVRRGLDTAHHSSTGISAPSRVILTSGFRNILIKRRPCVVLTGCNITDSQSEETKHHSIIIMTHFIYICERNTNLF